ncbi:pyruvate dehydrogenase complex dihydrolipoamide acetyltransferase [Thioclava pacifica]|uniref:Acetyltransferase component of pyruvate dehydrogenase complex n=1 Tax=Thioclava pacifica DSM 10166 TaxID=1353537 RepID=A0A074JLT7_9RHOB|nr:pyruvate dehydrogenase complex dihydrolipoamide acetyltransferase [Thioclava pacifica]KEO56543.1 branched-chain alpha-keto acid dehydrogenase subunit E2 [Thioclava pacifica DSM 10166]
MATQILMPALSPTMEEGTLAKWLVKEGDTVSSGDILAEIETDKATMEFEAVDEGVIGKILVAEGTSGVKVNDPIAVLLEEGEDASAAEAAEAPAAAPAPEAKAEAAPAKAESTPSAPAPAAPQGSDGKRIFASPLARRIAADKGVDLAALSGSGPKGRIVKADVEAAQGSAAAPAKAASAAAPAQAASPAPAAAPSVSASTIAKMYEGRDYEEIALDGMRKTIAARLTEAKQTIPHFYLRRSVKLDALMKFRSQLNKQLEGRGVKLSVNDFIIKACALALQAVPNANAVWAGDRVFKLKPSDVAVAVAIEGGLFTPVLKDAESKSLSTLSAEMKDLATRARDRKLAPHEYQGGSFAISNLGMFGIENFDAVINPPHGAILAVGAGIKQPVVNDAGDIEVATVMSMTLSVDHRVIDGALGAELLNAICENLENPMLMLA